VASYADFKDGVGIADPNDINNPCTYLLFGARAIQPLSGTWQIDQNMGFNLNGPAVGISNLVLPLQPVGGWLPASGGIDTNVACPIPGSPTVGDHSLWLVWSGVNWRSAESDSFTDLRLCAQQSFSSSSPGCLALPDASMRLWASACNWNEANFGAVYNDGKGKYIGGQPFDTIEFKSDQMKCNAKPHSALNQANNAWKRTVDYTDTIQDFTAGGAAQTFDLIKNAAVVPQGFGPAYMAVCWQMTYLDYTNPLVPTSHTALTHDWKLILDVGLGGKKGGGPQEIIDALLAHYGGQQVGDQYVGGTNLGMRGFYSDDAGNPKGTDFKTGAVGVVGENGFPCGNGGVGPAIPYTSKAKKPAPII
jgi:hypothetical protein